MMLSKLWASFPSLTDWCNRCSLWGEALCLGKSGSQRARARSLSHQPALLSFFLTSPPSSPSSPAHPSLFPHQLALLPFITTLPSSPSCVCVYGFVHFACQSGQTEKSEERLINQQLQSKVNKKRWHHNGQWEHLFREGRELQEQIQLSQHR